MTTELIQQVANALSTLTIMSCLFLKVPQIMHMRRTQSAEGIYVQALLMEITGLSIMTLYNYTNGYSVMTYLEYPIILLQLYTMLYHVLKYKNMLYMPIVPLGTLAYVVTVLSFTMGVLPKNTLAYLVPLCPSLSGVAKVSYIYGIVKMGNADAVSLTTWSISITTNMVRVFTVYVDSADRKLMGNFAISTLLSGGVLGTALYYKNRPRVLEHLQSRRKSCHKG